MGNRDKKEEVFEKIVGQMLIHKGLYSVEFWAFLRWYIFQALSCR